jgi:hypothetical protein
MTRALISVLASGVMAVLFQRRVRQASGAFIQKKAVHEE